MLINCIGACKAFAVVLSCGRVVLHPREFTKLNGYIICRITHSASYFAKQKFLVLVTQARSSIPL